MRSPKDMDVVQIEVTNACERACSNCTRFCGHHKKPFVMDCATFRKAVDSMRDFTHCLGVMGGEPTLHPQFPDLCAYIRDNFPQSRPHHVFRGPSRDFVAEVDEKNLRLKSDTIRGLFSSLGKNYYKHFEVIQDTFGFQCLNDHMNPSTHGALLVTRRELGIPDDAWFQLRDRCWVQNLWSASITPKGAFFCEIAASLDMLLDGPGGWPVEKGWWQREPEDFGEQLQWCELCGAALALPKTDAREETDDISPEWRRRLEKLGSGKLRRGGVRDFDVSHYDPAAYQVTHHHRPYLADKAQRMSSEDRVLLPTGIVHAHGIEEASAHMGRYAEKWIYLTDQNRVDDPIPNLFYENIFNPGCLYSDEHRQFFFFNTSAAALHDATINSLVDLLDHYPSEKIIFFDLPNY